MYFGFCCGNHLGARENVVSNMPFQVSNFQAKSKLRLKTVHKPQNLQWQVNAPPLKLKQEPFTRSMENFQGYEEHKNVTNYISDISWLYIFMPLLQI